MKVIEFKQENICYMFKNKDIRIERDDIWGGQEEYPESIMSYYNLFSIKRDDTVRVVYMYGQGGIGKTFVCQEIKERMEKLPCEGKRYVIALDLQRQKQFEDNLKCLADEIMGQMGKKDLFPRFYLAYYNYKLKTGENVQQEERSTKWDELHDNSTFSLAAGAASFISSFGTVSDIIDIANEGYKWLLKMRDNVQYKAVAHRIEVMDEKELRGQLVRYFATDFIELVREERRDKKKNLQKKSFVFLLDTVESMRYQVLRSGTEEDYLEWLVGGDGLLRLLPDSFWILFGREDIAWQNYDAEWKKSFHAKEFSRPTEEAVKEYLLKQLGNKMTGNSSKAVLEPLADEIIRQTDCFPLAVENCVDMYFRIWNENLRRNQIVDEEAADNFRPKLEDIRDLFLDKKGKRMISNRFMQYYTLQEREVLYTLVCLGTWTDELLEKLIWKGSVSNRLIYEEMCSTSFVKADSSGQKTIQGLMLEAIMAECPRNLKKQLFRNILKLMNNSILDSSYWLLYQSAVHIAEFLNFDIAEQELLGAEFIRGSAYLMEHAHFYELLQICEDLLKIAESHQEEDDRDIYNAARIGCLFALVCKKDNRTEKLGKLFEQEHFGYFSFQIWKSMLNLAEEIGAYEQTYEVTNLLTERLSDWRGQNPGDYYLLYRKRAELMQQLGQRFTKAQIEAEIHQLCELHNEVFYENLEIKKWNARLWADYYWYASKVSAKDHGEEYAKKINECMEEYRSCCTEREAEQDTILLQMKIMSMQVQESIDMEKMTDVALQGLRILAKLYGDKFCELPETQHFAQRVIVLRDLKSMEERDVELLRRVFASFYCKFYKNRDWKAFRIVHHLCFAVGLSGNVRISQEAEELLDVSDTIRRGILYLNNLQANDAKSRMILHVCYSLLEEQVSCLFHADRIGSELLLDKKCSNNLILLTLLQKETEYICQNAEAETERLGAFLHFVIDRKYLGTKESEQKRNLLGILNWCGVETDRALWRSDYVGDARGDEFAILDTLTSWNWEIDAQTNVWMVDLVLYIAWLLHERGEQLEDFILKTLKTGFSGEYDARARFWLDMVDDAEVFGEEWATYVRKLFCKELEQIFDNKEKLTETVQDKLADYDSRFTRLPGLGEHSSQEKTYEEKLQDLIEVQDYDTAKEMILKVFDETPKGCWYHENSVCLFYRDIIRNRSKEHYIEELTKTCEEWKVKDRHYQILRAYRYLDDKEEFVAYYWENELDIWKGLAQMGSLWCSVEELYNMFSYVLSVGKDQLSEDFLRKICELFSGEKSIYYAEGVLFHLEQIAEWIPFEEVWNRDLCVKTIKIYNCNRIYENLRRFLPEEELLNLYLETVPFNPRLENDMLISFFESAYYAWLKEKFKDVFDVRLKEKYPKVYEAKEKYERFGRENYHFRVNKLRMELKDSIREAL